MAQYKRSASRGGFSPVQVSRAEVQQILRQGERDSKLLRDLAKSDLAEKKRQNDGANAAFNFETEQQERNYRIVQENLSQDLAAAQDEARVAEIESQRESSAANTFKQFAALSATAGKMFQDYKEKQDEIVKENDIAKYFSDPEYKARVDAAAQKMSVENELVASDALAQRNAADIASDDKVPVAQMSQQITQLSPGQQEAYTRSQANEYPAYIAQWFANAGSEGEAIKNDPTLYAQKVTELRMQFLKERSLTGMSLEALSGSLDGMMQVEGSLLSANGDEYIRKQRQLARKNAFDTFAGLGDASSVEVAAVQAQQIWSQLLYANNYNFVEALNEFQKMATDAAPNVSDILLNKVSFTNGKTLADYPTRFKEVQDDRTRQAIDDENLAQRDAQRLLIQTNRETSVYDRTRELLKEAEGNPVRTAQIINGIREEQRRISGDFNVSDPLLDDLLTSGESEAAANWQREFEDDAEKGTLDLAKADIAPDQESRDRYRAAFQQQEERRYGPNFAEVKSTIDAYAQNLTEVPNQPKRGSDQRNPYEGLVRQDLMDQFKTKFEKYVSQGMGSAAAADTALGEVSQEVKDSLANADGARYTRDVDASGVKFTNPALSDTFRGPAVVPPEVINRNITDPNFPNIKGSVLTEAQLRLASKTYNARDGSFYIPNVVQRIADNSPNLTPIDLINKQIEAYNAESDTVRNEIPLLADDEYNERMDALDPEAVSIFSNIPEISPRRATRASIRSSSNGGQVLQSTNRMYQSASPTVQKLISAVIGKESGGNSSVTNASGSGAVGLGQVMPENVGPWTNTYLGRSMSYEEFRNDPDAQMTVVSGKLRDIYNSQIAAGYDEDIAIRRSASIWYSGQGGLYDNQNPQYWGNDVYPSIGSYTQNILDRVRNY